jgi:hypothetical protein
MRLDGFLASAQSRQFSKILKNAKILDFPVAFVQTLNHVSVCASWRE